MLFLFKETVKWALWDLWAWDLLLEQYKISSGASFLPTRQRLEDKIEIIGGVEEIILFHVNMQNWSCLTWVLASTKEFLRFSFSSHRVVAWIVCCTVNFLFWFVSVIIVGFLIVYIRSQKVSYSCSVFFFFCLKPILVLFWRVYIFEDFPWAEPFFALIYSVNL